MNTSRRLLLFSCLVSSSLPAESCLQVGSYFRKIDNDQGCQDRTDRTQALASSQDRKVKTELTGDAGRLRVELRGIKEGLNLFN